VFAGDNNSYKIEYDGGSITGTKAGTDMKLFLDGDHIRIMKGKNEVAVIPPQPSLKSAMDKMYIGVWARLSVLQCSRLV